MSITHRQRLGVYRHEAGTHVIEIRLRELRQLYNTLDPSPFHRKDLHPAAEEYLVSALREIGARPSRLLVHLPPQTSAEEAADAATAIHNYFAYRARHTAEQLRRLLSRAVLSLAVGLGFLSACLWLRLALGQGVARSILAEGLLILGWVAMWRPVEIFLYDWWPELGKRRLFDRLARIEVQTSVGVDVPAGQQLLHEHPHAEDREQRSAHSSHCRAAGRPRHA
jgi:hypothetical protein